MTIQNYFSQKIPSKRLTTNSDLLSFFNIQSILSKEPKSIINLAKLLLCLSSFCPNKGNNLKKVSGLDLSLVQIYYDSVYLFLEKNTEKKSFINNSTLSTSILEEKNAQKKEIEKLKKIVEEKDLIIRKYKTFEFAKNDISVIQSDQDFLGGGEDINFEIDFDIKNITKNYKIEKTDSFSFEKINTKQIINDVSQKNINVRNNSSYNFFIAGFNFYLLGGNLLQKKIDILDETILKNREMYQNIIANLEKEKESLKQRLEKLSKNKSGISSEEFIKFKNEKCLEIENLKKMINEKEITKNKEIEAMKVQIDQEKMIMKSNNEKNIEMIKNEYEKKISNLNNQINEYDNKLKVAENKLKSDPYLAKEILSHTLYDFALTIMNEK
jgi:hypothetical protein